MRTILFVCSSNRTRSPLAAAYFQHLLAQEGCTDCQADSAGLRTIFHGDINPNVAEALKLEGVEPLRIGSQLLTPKLIKSADLLVCMTHDQMAEVKKKYISATNKTIALMDVLHSDKDIFDPNKEPVQRFTDCLAMMKPALKALAERICD